MKEHASLFKCRLYYIKSIHETIDSGFNECITNYQSQNGIIYIIRFLFLHLLISNLPTYE